MVPTDITAAVIGFAPSLFWLSLAFLWLGLSLVLIGLGRLWSNRE